MPIQIFRSTDASAPVLDGQAGSLITVLDAILVNGYGAQSAVGWTKAFSGTNKAAYRLPAGTTQHYLQILDNQVTNSNYATGRAYESMSDVDTGVDPFPTVADEATYYFHKSDTNSADAVEWVAYTNGEILYFASSRPTATYNHGWSFGYIASLVTGDNWTTFVAGSDSSAIANNGLLYDADRYVARDETGINKSITLTTSGIGITASQSGNVSSHGIYPSTVNNQLPLVQLSYTTTTTPGALEFEPLRMYIPGVFLILADWNEVLPEPLTSTTFSDQNGVTYDYVQWRRNSNVGGIAMQTSGEWT